MPVTQWKANENCKAILEGQNAGFVLFIYKNSIRKRYGKAWFYSVIYNWSREDGYAGNQRDSRRRL